MQVLHDQFSGKGNFTRRIVEAERMKKYLHYKNERSLSFEIFLTKCQKILNIYNKEGEPMLEDTKLRFLFNCTQHASLQVQLEALKANITTRNTVTYTTAANHLTTAVSQLADYVAKSRVAGAIGTGTNNAGITNYESNSMNFDSWIPN